MINLKVNFNVRIAIKIALKEKNFINLVKYSHLVIMERKEIIKSMEEEA